MAVDFLPFANDLTANVVTQSAYAAAAAGGYVQYGFSAGIAPSNQLNKVWRQSSVMTAAIANLIASSLTVSVLDSGGAASVTVLQTQLSNMIQSVAVAALPPVPPQGRLTLTTNTPVLQADVAATSVVYYTAYTGNFVPVWNGTSFTNLSFAADLTLTLTAAAAANGIVDVFAINNAGTLAIGFGPVWATATPGSGARGSGAGTTAIARQSGIWVNANTITLLNGATTYTAVPAGQATYLGSVSVNAVAAQTSCTVTYGQSRKWGVWNAYNRVPLILKAGDATASWAYATNVWRASNNNAANSVQTFAGLPEEHVYAQFVQAIVGNNSGQILGIGVNSTAAPTEFNSAARASVAFNMNSMAATTVAPALGVQTLTCLENNSGGSGTYNGTSANMMFTATFRG